MRAGVIGATGLVGRTVLEVLDTPEFREWDIRAFATGKIEKRRLPFRESEIEVEALGDTPPELDYALFCAPAEVARKIAPVWRDAGIRIVDNSSVFRLVPEVPLVVPEVNGDAVHRAHGLIANPNCSTIQLAMAVAPLQRAFGLRGISVATYQSVSGAGAEAVEQWKNECSGKSVAFGESFSKPIHGNVLPMIGAVDVDGYSIEERKLMLELPKILDDDSFVILATAVRVPVEIGHSEAVEVSLGSTPPLVEVEKVLRKAQGLVYYEDKNLYPTPLEARGRDEVFVGRLRAHPQESGTFLFWVVADNLRRGAATNAVRIILRWMDSP